MAEKIDKPAARTSTDKAAATAARELETLVPEQTARIAGVDVVMREPTWIESLELDPLLEPLIAELNDEAGADAERITEPGALQRLTFRHRDVMLDMMALCAGVERDWIERLTDREGQRFFMLFWMVNSHFFGRRLAIARARRQAREGGTTIAGRTSSPH